MKLILSCSLLLFCTMTFAQQKENRKQIFPKTDTAKVLNMKGLKEIQTRINTDYKQQYKTLVATPKDTSLYMALKEAKRDHSKYRILNSVAPEKSIPDTKKAQPTK
ncbi:hypothetical protein SAMN05421594_2416 [Chryseobacterium oleae]|uniref:Uncharacterized protein n=1 Tax=Chryseobacterium oleae TaxID=491207 RepID=A0A1I4YIF2_CHROL|nr:hypothetical protein [Chryseobacterium oleae]SFN37339.1 hypothetical protein SAMN05421594_2416 [Chryseobacterium oleae]